ncbi:putative metal-dependent phosphoesterase (php family) [hydrocarbon metagenome]|uniref:Putative metal-dependent phosphoesterase (Php family) n=1 Tax=hydrocarbon metagenome TaxID=938273 RepID=A0A0W8G7M3_9ZZZZ
MPGIDLHTHTTASDGTATPRELIRLAAEAGLTAVAITDHDTVAGLPEALAAGREYGVTVVGGVELSVFDGQRALHLVGLFVPQSPGELGEALARARHRRHDRNRQILEKLAALGIPLDYGAVLALAGGPGVSGGTGESGGPGEPGGTGGTGVAVGRPHIAAALLNSGRVKSMKEAFERYLGATGLAYVPKDKMTLDRAVSLLAAVGALPVLAHPYLLREKGRSMERLVAGYRERGVAAMEAYYSEHSESQTREYLALAAKLDMGVSGGSDFHGEAKPGVLLGRGRGRLFVPESVLVALAARRDGMAGRP